MRVVAVRTALAIASSGSRPHRSVRVKNASALTTTARSSLSRVIAAGARLAANGAVYPGFSGTARPGWLDSMGTLAGVLGGLLEDLDLTDVIVAGSSVGGWVAAELALAAPERVGRLVLIDPAGLDSADHPIADFFSLTPDQLADLSWANPEGHRIDPAAMPEAQRAILLGNREALLAYGGRSMADPALAARLGGITAPTLVIWGEADRIVTPGYGKEYAAAIPGAVFRMVPAAGHLPQLENPEAVLGLFGELVTAAGYQ